jgi:hypothetical protein
VPDRIGVADHGDDHDEEEESQEAPALTKTSRRRGKEGPSGDNYTGSWTVTTIGPLKDDKDALRSSVAKNNSTNPEDKVWSVVAYPRPMTREKAKKKGLDVDDKEVAKTMLTLHFELKQDPSTVKTYVYDAPNWDNQSQITKLTKKIGQNRRREAGSEEGTRHSYTTEEIHWLAKWFKDHPEKQGEGMPTKEWKKVTAAFNPKFKDRTIHVESKKEKLPIGNRSQSALMGICNRDDRILAARKLKGKNLKGKAADEDADAEEAQEEELAAEQGQAEKAKTAPGRPRKAR